MISIDQYSHVGIGVTWRVIFTQCRMPLHPEMQPETVLDQKEAIYQVSLNMPLMQRHILEFLTDILCVTIKATSFPGR